MVHWTTRVKQFTASASATDNDRAVCARNWLNEEARLLHTFYCYNLILKFTLFFA